MIGMVKEKEIKMAAVMVPTKLCLFFMRAEDFVNLMDNLLI